MRGSGIKLNRHNNVTLSSANQGIIGSSPTGGAEKLVYDWLFYLGIVTIREHPLP